MLYDKVRVEPTDASFKHAIEFVTQTARKVTPTGHFDAFVAVLLPSPSVHTAHTAHTAHTHVL